MARQLCRGRVPTLRSSKIEGVRRSLPAQAIPGEQIDVDLVDLAAGREFEEVRRVRGDARERCRERD